MSRDKKEDNHPARLEEDANDQPVSASAGGPFIRSKSSEVVVSHPLEREKNRLHALALDRLFVENALLPFLDKSDISMLNLVSKTTQRLFQPNRLQMLADKLLLHVMKGEQAKAEVILKICPDLLLIEGTAIDYSKRRFHCTAFQYAVWALDTRYMCQMMLNCLPRTENGERIKQGLLTQLLEQESVGIDYQYLPHKINDIEVPISALLRIENCVKSETIKGEAHYDFIPILETMKKLFEHCQSNGSNYRIWTEASKNESRRLFMCIGLHQRYLPAHVAQHYCDPDIPFGSTEKECYNPGTCELFKPTPGCCDRTFSPSFQAQKFTRSLTCMTHDEYDRKNSDWFSKDFFSRYGNAVPNGILRGGASSAWSCLTFPNATPFMIPMLQEDIRALTTLFTVRIRDLELLKEQLKSPLKQQNTRTCVIC